MTDNTYIVIPAKDEATRIAKVIYDVKRQGFQQILVVDDGSSDGTGDVAERAGALVYRHSINLGAGAATQTGIEAARKNGADFIVTLDADQQHFPEDIPLLLNKLKDGKLDLVIGNRFMGGDNKIPLTREILNGIGNIVSWMASGVWVHDSQSGFRAFTAEFAEKSPLTSDSYEFAIEMIRYVKLHKAKLAEVPIKVKYTKETMAKGQNLLSGLRMVSRVFRLF